VLASFPGLQPDFISQLWRKIRTEVLLDLELYIFAMAMIWSFL